MLNFLDAITSNDVSENLIQASLVEESFTNQTLRFLSDINLEYNKYQKELYYNLTEASQLTTVTEANIIIHESFGDFFDAIKSIFKKIIEFIKSIVDKFISLFSKKETRTSYAIETLCSYCENSNESVEFRTKGYEFTIDDTVPVIEDITITNTTVSSKSINDIEKTKGNLLKLKSKLNDIVAEKNDYFDKLRAKILNRDIPISKDNFQEELFKTFRNLKTDETEIKIDKDIIKEIINQLRNNEDIKNKVKQDRKKMETRYNANLDALKKSFKDYEVENVELMTIIDQINKLDVAKVKKISEIHCLSFSNKLDAILARNTQNKIVLNEYYNKLLKKEGVL